MTRPDRNTSYDARDERVLCKGAFESAHANHAALEGKDVAAERRGDSLLHGRVNEPKKWEGAPQALCTSGDDGHEATEHDQHVEAVTQRDGCGSTEGQGHRGLLLPDLSPVRERGNRQEEGVSGASIRRSDAERVRHWKDDPNVWINRAFKTKYPLTDWEIEVALRIPHKDYGDLFERRAQGEA